MLQAQDLLDVVDLGIAHDLGVGGIPYIEQLAPAKLRGRIAKKTMT